MLMHTYITLRNPYTAISLVNLMKSIFLTENRKRLRKLCSGQMVSNRLSESWPKRGFAFSIHEERIQHTSVSGPGPLMLKFRGSYWKAVKIKTESESCSFDTTDYTLMDGAWVSLGKADFTWQQVMHSEAPVHLPLRVPVNHPCTMAVSRGWCISGCTNPTSIIWVPVLC